MCGYAAERNDFLACVGASDSRVMFGNTVRNIEKRDTTLLFVFVNRYYDDSRRILARIQSVLHTPKRFTRILVNANTH